MRYHFTYKRKDFLNCVPWFFVFYKYRKTFIKYNFIQALYINICYDLIPSSLYLRFLPIL